MLQVEVLVRECGAVIYGCRSSAVTVQEVTALNHEVGNHAMELAAFVTHGFPQR